MHFYCRDCGVRRGTLRPFTPTLLTASSYQHEKVLKHTIPVSRSHLNGVFTHPGSETYTRCVVATVCSGHVQVDDAGRTNVVWVASNQVGLLYQGGHFVGGTTAVKVVLADDYSRMHGFPIRESELQAASCMDCTRPVPY